MELYIWSYIYMELYIWRRSVWVARLFVCALGHQFVNVSGRDVGTRVYSLISGRYVDADSAIERERISLINELKHGRDAS